MANVKVILREDVDKLGNTGDIVAVRTGYARNFLLPRRLADLVGSQAEKQKAALRKKAERRAVERAEAFARAIEVLNGKTVEILERSYKEQLYGSVTTTRIAQAIFDAFQVKLDSRSIKLEHPIREIGKTELEVRLTKDLHATITVEVKAQIVAGEEDQAMTEEELEEKVVADVEAAEKQAEEGQEPTGRKAIKRRRKEEKSAAEAGAEGSSEEHEGEAKAPAGDAEASTEAKPAKKKKKAQAEE